jgi:hypothetical protein
MIDLDRGEVLRLRVFRLVNKDHDSVDIGMYLTRISDHSNQKIADACTSPLAWIPTALCGANIS